MYTKNVKVLFVYCQHRQDEDLQKALEEHLHELKWLDVESQWHKYQDDSQQNWSNKIYEDLNTANLIVPLISTAFLNKPYLIDLIELAKKRYEEEDLSLIPVLLRQNSGWQRVLGDFTPLPSNGKAVNDKSWTNQDEAFVEIAQGIVEKVEELKAYQKKLQEYEHQFYEVIQQEDNLSDYAREQLNNFKRTWGLKDKDTSLIEKIIYRKKEKEEFQQKLWQWKQPFFAAIQQRYSRILGIPVAIGLLVFVLGGAFQNIQDRNSPNSHSSTSNQIRSLTVDLNSDGWIFIGRANNPSTSISFGDALNSNSTSITPAIIPSVGSVVTVVKPVKLRNNRPQKPAFDYTKQKEVGIIQDGEKVVILEAFVIPKTFAVWVKVQKCYGSCK